MPCDAVKMIFTNPWRDEPMFDVDELVSSNPELFPEPAPDGEPGLFPGLVLDASLNDLDRL